jgi:NADPH-dependent curcumin reductase CurA
MPRAMEAIQDLMAWISSDQLIYQVDLQEGFDNIPATLQRLYGGQNLGKQLLKIGS